MVLVNVPTTLALLEEVSSISSSTLVPFFQQLHMWWWNGWMVLQATNRVLAVPWCIANLQTKKQKLLVRSRYHNMCRYFTLQTWLITKLSILHVLTFWQFFSRFQDFHLEKIINPWVQMMWHLELRHCKISSKHPPQNGIDHEWFSLVGNNINALGHCQLSMGFLTPINGPLNRFPCI